MNYRYLGQMIGVREGHRGLITVGPKFDRHRVSKNHPFRYPKFELFKSIDTSDTGIIILVICRISHHLSRLDWNFRNLGRHNPKSPKTVNFEGDSHTFKWHLWTGPVNMFWGSIFIMGQITVPWMVCEPFCVPTMPHAAVGSSCGAFEVLRQF